MQRQKWVPFLWRYMQKAGIRTKAFDSGLCICDSRTTCVYFHVIQCAKFLNVEYQSPDLRQMQAILTHFAEEAKEDDSVDEKPIATLEQTPTETARESS